jgi:hypothetical protein
MLEAEKEWEVGKELKYEGDDSYLRFWSQVKKSDSLLSDPNSSPAIYTRFSLVSV